MKKILFNIMGIIIIIISTIYILTYLNLVNIGFTFKEYIFFIIKRIECIILIVGTLILRINNKGE